MEMEIVDDQSKELEPLFSGEDNLASLYLAWCFSFTTNFWEPHLSKKAAIT
jgi:hypothetical protein